MPRRMTEVAFRNEQWTHRYDNHIKPINEYVDELRKSTRGKAPYVAPIHGGINARLLCLLRDPGPMTLEENGGSGFLCIENNDPTAETTCNLVAEAKLHAGDILPWNAYPWYINRKPTGGELEDGVVPLKHIIDLLPKLRVVMLLGGDARKAWRKCIRRYPNLVAERGLSVIETHHTSDQALWTKDPEERDKRMADRRNAFWKAACCLD